MAFCVAIFIYQEMVPNGKISSMIKRNQVKEFIRENSRILIRTIAKIFEVITGTVHCLCTIKLAFPNDCVEWVPAFLSEEQKCLQMNLFLQHLIKNSWKGNAFLFSIIADAVIILYHSANCHRLNENCPSPKQFEVLSSAGKII